MFARYSVRGLLLLCLGIALVGCGNPSGLDSIQVSPATQSLAVGQTAQLSVVGTYGNAKRPSTQNVTTLVTWSSSVPSVATVDAHGLITAVAPGNTNITASTTAFNGPTSSSASITVTGSGGGGGVPGGSLTSLTIIPSAITVGNLQLTGQFLAIGTFSVPPFVRDLTNSPTVKWISATPNLFPVTTNTAGNLGAPAGIVTAYGNGSGVITAEATNPGDGTIQTATANFNCPLKLPTPTEPGSCFPGSQATPLLLTLTVYNLGLNTTNWRVVAPSATGTQYPLHCGPGVNPAEPADEQQGSVCTTTYPANFQLPSTNPNLLPNTIILEATGGAFGGWSDTCQPSDSQGNLLPLPAPFPAPPVITPAGPNYCVVQFTGLNATNVTVGAVFN